MEINMVNGVNMEGQPFVSIEVLDDHVVVAKAQLSPTEARTHALYMLEVAEAAEQDAATLRVMRDILDTHEQADTMAGLVVKALRDARDPR